MNYWYTLNLGDAMLASEAIANVTECFMEAFIKAGQPLDMAVFARHESEGRLHCEVIIYFSPAAQQIAETLNAKPCIQPTRTDLTLLAGKPEIWDLLFQENLK